MKALLTLLIAALVAPTILAQTRSTAETGVSPPSTFAVELVASVSTGTAMNDVGDVTGISRVTSNCGSTCLPPEETVVWRNGVRIVLPSVPGLTGITVTGMNNQGWIVGYAGPYDFIKHAVVWKPNFGGYDAIDIGNLPGRTYSGAVGIDDLGRVVGWSSTSSIPQTGTPFMWTEAGGMVDLAAMGFPSEAIQGISRGGTVATSYFWYRLGDPGSVVPMPTPPTSFFILFGRVVINDNGDQARFLGTGTQGLIYPFRFYSDGGGTWQQISFVPTGHMTSAGLGSINDALDVSLTVQSAGMIAFGPNEPAQSLNPFVSPAYAGSPLASSGPMNASGEILASMIIGQSGKRLVRLVPAEPCLTNCIRVSAIQMRGTGPGYCDQGRNNISTRLTVTDEAGIGLPGVTITGHFFDDYWLDKTVVGTTNARGRVSFTYRGPPCVGAIAFLVTDATSSSGRTLDRTTGVLTNHVIPTPTDPLQASANAAENSEAVPSDFSMERAYPNPFNPATTIRFSLPESAEVQVIVYNVLGSEVARLVDGTLEAGQHEVAFDASDLPSGVYFARLTAGSGFTQTQRLTLVK